MPRPSIDENLSTGMLTLPNVAELIGVSTKIVRRMVDQGMIKSIQLPASREVRVSGLSLIKYCEECGMEIDKRLTDAAKVWKVKFANDNFELKQPCDQDDDAQVTV